MSLALSKLAKAFASARGRCPAPLPSFESATRGLPLVTSNCQLCIHVWTCPPLHYGAYGRFSTRAFAARTRDIDLEELEGLENEEESVARNVVVGDSEWYASEAIC
jgi:hypothetical protein